jgi:hypothetical protein
MHKWVALLLVIFVTGSLPGQIDKVLSKKMGKYPILFLDSAETNIGKLNGLNPFDISNINIVKPKRARKYLGDRGIDGAIYVTTKNAAKIRNWNFLKSKSEVYSQQINSPQADTVVQYVVNGVFLTDSSAAGSLFLVTEKNFKKLKIIDRQVDRTEYPTSKRFIVMISARRPNKGLVKPKEFK